jgi:hypothetical protein
MEPSDATPEESPFPSLTDRDRAILDFERDWWQHPGSKEDSIRQEFGLSGARYYQVLGGLLSSEAAVAYDPMLVKRLQRLKEERRRSRQARISPASSKNREES